MMRPPSTPDPMSLAAAHSVEDTAPVQRYRVLALIDAIGPISAERISEAMGLGGNSIRPRLVELEQDGLVIKDGEGKTRSGRRCHLYRSTLAGIKALGHSETLELWP